tara:strand:+ start:184 stop:372 length:189 start_codon:yes stop_codon:yes gene_type:complete
MKKVFLFFVAMFFISLVATSCTDLTEDDEILFEIQNVDKHDVGDGGLPDPDGTEGDPDDREG